MEHSSEKEYLWACFFWEKKGLSKDCAMQHWRGLHETSISSCSPQGKRLKKRQTQTFFSFWKNMHFSPSWFERFHQPRADHPGSWNKDLPEIHQFGYFFSGSLKQFRVQPPEQESHYKSVYSSPCDCRQHEYHLHQTGIPVWSWNSHKLQRSSVLPAH